MVPLHVSATNIAILRSQRSDVTIVKSWWEKENFSVNSNSSSKAKASLVNVTDVMEINDKHIPSLRGWFLKEKRDKFKRNQSVLPVSMSSVRRWFTIERVSNSSSDDTGGDPFAELALCYYKRSSSDKQGRCGWFFLSDVLSLSQDVPNRWITIEHPTRIMRLQSPTPAQHRIWFSTLSKCCKHVQKDALSPSLETASETRRQNLPYFSEDSVRKAKRNSLKSAQEPLPSTQKDALSPSLETASETRRQNLPYFSEDSVRKAKRNSLKSAQEPLPSTQKDELQFLREITGGRSKEQKEVLRKNPFHGSSTMYSDSSALPVKAQEQNKLMSERRSCKEEKENRPFMQKETAEDLGGASTAKINGTNQTSSLGVSGQLEATATTSSSRLEEKTELVKPHGHVLIFHGNGSDSQATRKTGGHFHMHEPGKLSFKKDDPGLKNHDRHTSHLASSRQISTSSSSSFRFHFGKEDDNEVSADDDFLTDDWDV